MGMNLTYRSHARVEDLAPNECTIHRAADGTGKRWWLLWIYVYRDDVAGALEDIAVPVFPNGSYHEDGPGGRTWGLTKSAPGTWQIAPSINVLNDADARSLHAGKHPTGASIWHQTPTLVGVPEGEPWAAGDP